MTCMIHPSLSLPPATFNPTPTHTHTAAHLCGALHSAEHLRRLVLDTVWASAGGWAALGAAVKVNTSLTSLRCGGRGGPRGQWVGPGVECGLGWGGGGRSSVQNPKQPMADPERVGWCGVGCLPVPTRRKWGIRLPLNEGSGPLLFLAFPPSTPKRATACRLRDCVASEPGGGGGAGAGAGGGGGGALGPLCAALSDQQGQLAELSLAHNPRLGEAGVAEVCKVRVGLAVGARVWGVGVWGVWGGGVGGLHHSHQET